MLLPLALFLPLFVNQNSQASFVKLLLHGLGKSQPATKANKKVLVPLEFAEVQIPPKAVGTDSILLCFFLPLPFPIILITLWGLSDEDKGFLQGQLVMGCVDGMVAYSDLHLPGTLPI